MPGDVLVFMLLLGDFSGSFNVLNSCNIEFVSLDLVGGDDESGGGVKFGSGTNKIWP